jgi:hypothetical protein
MTLVPAGNTNGTILGTIPSTAVGARFYISGSDSVTFTISSPAPSSPPSVTQTISLTTTGPNWDENLAGGQMIYVTAISGTPRFRWY